MIEHNTGYKFKTKIGVFLWVLYRVVDWYLVRLNATLNCFKLSDTALIKHKGNKAQIESLQESRLEIYDMAVSLHKEIINTENWRVWFSPFVLYKNYKLVQRIKKNAGPMEKVREKLERRKKKII